MTWRTPRRTAALLLAALSVGACETRPLTCGEYPEGGGPAVVRTRDQQVCELVRQRVMQWLAAAEDLDLAQAEELYERSRRWRGADTVDELLARVERDAGEAFATAVRRGIEAGAADGGKPLGPDCDDVEACLVAGALKGLDLGLAQRSYYVRGRRPPGDAPTPGTRGGVQLEDLVD